MVIINPPIVPAAKENQKASLSKPIIKGINPRIVDTTIRKIGVIFAFHAFIYKPTVGEANNRELNYNADEFI